MDFDHRAEAAVLMRSLRVPPPRSQKEVDMTTKLTHYP